MASIYNFSKAPLIISSWKLLLKKKKNILEKNIQGANSLELRFHSTKFQVYKFRPFLSKRRSKFYNRNSLEDFHILKSKRTEMAVLKSIRTSYFRGVANYTFTNIN